MIRPSIPNRRIASASHSVDAPLPHSTTSDGRSVITRSTSTTSRSGDAAQPRVAGSTSPAGSTALRFCNASSWRNVCLISFLTSQMPVSARRAVSSVRVDSTARWPIRPPDWEHLSYGVEFAHCLRQVRLVGLTRASNPRRRAYRMTSGVAGMRAKGGGGACSSDSLTGHGGLWSGHRKRPGGWTIDYVGTEHLLLGVTHESIGGLAAEVLESLGIGLETVRQQVEEVTGRGKQAPSGQIPFTPEAKEVLRLALSESRALGHNYIGTEHILLGLIREGDGVAAQVLTGLGADLDGPLAGDPAPGGVPAQARASDRMTTLPRSPCVRLLARVSSKRRGSGPSPATHPVIDTTWTVGPLPAVS